MGGARHNGQRIDRDDVMKCALSFMTQHIVCTDFIIAGSYRREKQTCGDIELVIPCETMSQFATVQGSISTVFGCTESGRPVCHGLHCGVQFDLFPCYKHQVGSMLLHTTGSWKFNKYMREVAKSRGYLLNQYGLWTAADHKPIVVSDTEDDFFKYLGIRYVKPNERSMI